MFCNRYLIAMVAAMRNRNVTKSYVFSRQVKRVEPANRGRQTESPPPGMGQGNGVTVRELGNHIEFD